MFWCPIFHFAHGMPLAELVSSITDYEIIKERDTARVDYASFFCGGKHPPLFLCEAAGHSVATEEFTKKGFLHKDFRKLAWSLFRSFCYFAKKPEVLNELRIYGALVSTTQIQFCILFESNPDLSIVNDDRASSIVFQTSSKQWFVDLSAANPWHRVHPSHDGPKSFRPADCHI
jgi:hypothetical protein